MVLLDFWADWCQPCKMLSPVFEEMARHHPDIFFGKVNTELAQDLAEAFQVRSVPTLMAFKKGELVFEQAGLPTPAQLESLLDGLRKLEPEPAGSETEPG
jgi:thioredoxin